MKLDLEKPILNAIIDTYGNKKLLPYLSLECYTDNISREYVMKLNINVDTEIRVPKYVIEKPDPDKFKEYCELLFMTMEQKVALEPENIITLDGKKYRLVT